MDTQELAERLVNNQRINRYWFFVEEITGHCLITLDDGALIGRVINKYVAEHVVNAHNAEIADLIKRLQESKKNGERSDKVLDT